MQIETIESVVAMSLYMAVIIGIGIFYAKRANASSDDYFIGGRSLGPYVTAMSAEASDMSGWLLMGLPGVAYFTGVADAFWTAIGLAIGTYVNWLIVAKRLRIYSQIAGDAITIPDFFSNRFKEEKPIILSISSVFILIFFTVYAASCFVTVGKLFSTLFNQDYIPMMIIGAVFVLAYTFLGGFLAESVSDFLQSIVMILALTIVLVLGVQAAGGLGNVFENLGKIPGFVEFFTIADPALVDGQQQVINGAPQFGPAKSYGIITILSMFSWGLGYFGVPQVLLRFMAIRKTSEIDTSRRAAIIWVVISLTAAVMIGLVGRYLAPDALVSAAESESIFIVSAQTLMSPFLAGIVMAGILAATISSSDSYLLIASSALAKNIFQGIWKREASDKQVMWVTRVTLLTITIIGIFLALDESSVIFQIVSFAWAGFGATFGPIMLFSLFSEKVTREGAIAGMLTGGIMVFVWKMLLNPLGGIFAIYELLPAFLLSCAAIMLVSKMTTLNPDIATQHATYLAEYKQEINKD